jgi:hypothetical protein
MPGPKTESVGLFDLQPHLYRYWLNPKVDDPEQFDEEVREICDLYATANEQLEQKCHLSSTDEMSGIRTLERKAMMKSIIIRCKSYNRFIFTIKMFKSAD